MPHYQHPQRKYLNNKKPEPKLARLEADWNEEYRETERLLEEKLLNFVRLNKQLKKNIPSPYHLLEIYEGTITINLSLFNNNYREKFINSNINGYSFRFMEQLRPLLLDYMEETRIRKFNFTFIFKLGEVELEKIEQLSME